MRSIVKVLLLGICLIMAGEAKSYSCSGGKEETINNITFCKSNQVMNWLSALTWCDSIGGKLAEYDTVCPNGNCSAFKGKFDGKGHGYINKISGNRINRLNFKEGSIEQAAPNRPIGYDYENAGTLYDKKAITDMYALCQPK